MAANRWASQGRELGATSLEYAFVAVLIAVAIIGSVRMLGEATDDNICSPTVVLNETTGAGEC